MKILLKMVCLGVVMMLPLSPVEASDSGPPQVKKPVSKIGVPVYKPPLRGAPSGRIGGGSRGGSDRESFSLHVLAPDHVGYSKSNQPCLYWYISNSTKYPLELTVTERKAVKPLMEKTLTVADGGGIQSACMSDYDVTLKEDVPYKWFVTLVVDPERRSKDIMAGGILAVTGQFNDMQGAGDNQDQKELLQLYAQNGLWYDAIDLVSKMISASPGDPELHQWRKSLLEQAGLLEVAEYENSLVK